MRFPLLIHKRIDKSSRLNFSGACGSRRILLLDKRVDYHLWLNDNGGCIVNIRNIERLADFIKRIRSIIEVEGSVVGNIDNWSVEIACVTSVFVKTVGGRSIRKSRVYEGQINKKK
jgi:hypothetical protein